VPEPSPPEAPSSPDTLSAKPKPFPVIPTQPSGFRVVEHGKTPPESAFAPVYFGFDSTAIRPSDTMALRAVMDKLRQRPDASVYVTGYCDPLGSERYNALLGRHRAESVRDWLMARGIDRSRIGMRTMGSRAVKTADPARYWTERRCEFELRW